MAAHQSRARAAETQAHSCLASPGTRHASQAAWWTTLEQDVTRARGITSLPCPRLSSVPDHRLRPSVGIAVPNQALLQRSVSVVVRSSFVMIISNIACLVGSILLGLPLSGTEQPSWEWQRFVPSAPDSITATAKYPRPRPFVPWHTNTDTYFDSNVALPLLPLLFLLPPPGSTATLRDGPT
jgi:hypothetical protein